MGRFPYGSRHRNFIAMIVLICQYIIWPFISPLVNRFSEKFIAYHQKKAGAHNPGTSGKSHERKTHTDDTFRTKANADVSARGRHLKTLGLGPKADKQQIRARYRQLVKRYHPDRHQASSESVKRAAAEKMRRINVAYDALEAP